MEESVPPVLEEIVPPMPACASVEYLASKMVDCGLVSLHPSADCSLDVVATLELSKMADSKMADSKMAANRMRMSHPL